MGIMTRSASVLLLVCSFFLTILIDRARSQEEFESPKTYSSYRRNPVCNPSDYFRYPKSIEDVVDIVREAISRNTTLKPFGSRHSQTDIICTEGIPVATYDLKWINMNPDNTATVGAGVSLHDATEFMRLNGRALKTTPAFGNITIAGAIGTGAHGSTLKYNSSISDQVLSLTIVDGLGNVREIKDTEDLHAFRVHLGLLGFVVSVTLDTVPLYKVSAHNYLVPDDVLKSGIVNQWILETDQMALYWFPSARQVVVSNWTIVDVETPGNAYTNDHVPPSSWFFNLFMSPGVEYFMHLTSKTCSSMAAAGYTMLAIFEKYFMYGLLGDVPFFVPIYTEDGKTTKNPAVGYYDLMFAPICREDPGAPLKCIWAHDKLNLTILDTEFSFALKDLPEFIKKVEDIGKKVPSLFAAQGILLRFSRASKSYMSASYARDTVHFEFYMMKRQNPYRDPSASLAAYQAIIQIAVRDFGAGAHWAKAGMVFHNKEFIESKTEPEARSKFIDAMNKFDPNGIFMNNFGRRIKGLDTKIDLDPKVNRCALLDNCLCESDSDCGVNQICGTIPGYPDKPVCRVPNDDKVVSQIQNFKYPKNSLVAWLITNPIRIIAGAKLKCTASLFSRLFGVFG